MHPTVTITAKGEQRLRSGHPWIYRSDIADVHAEGGDVVAVLSPRQQTLGHALFSDRSQITLRMLTRGEAPFDTDVLRRRIAASVAYRHALAPDATAYRLIHGEGDLLPSLVVDRYGDYLVVQTLSQGMDRLTAEVVRILVEALSPAGILARNDPRVRELEGLPRAVEVLHGDVPVSVPVREGFVEYDVDLWKGQKTGLFLDQRENHEATASYARGRVLDCFSYHGGFALRLARQCDTVEALDVSAEAVAHIRANAARNALGNVEAREVNVFDELRALEKAGVRYDTIVLDPPAFAKNKAAVTGAVSGYKEINLRAMRLLNPGGVLVTCSCSYNVGEALFSDVVREASVDSQVPMVLVEKRMQGRDHPVLIGVPETYYLKCFVLRRIE